MILARPYRIAFLIFLAALSVRLFFVLPSLMTPNFDGMSIAGDGYFEIAQNLLAGNGFARLAPPPVIPDSVRTPLYPLIIAGLQATFGGSKALLILQILLGGLTAVITWLFAKEFLGDGVAALLTGLAVALEPLGAYLSGIMLTETVFTFLFLLTIYLFTRYLKNPRLLLLILFSLLLGATTLVRPTTQYLPLFLIFIMWLSNERRVTKVLCIRALILLGVFLLVLSPWLYRNYEVFGSANLNVQQVTTVFGYLVPSTIALENNITFEQAQREFYAKEHVESVEDINLGNADKFKKHAHEELARHPVGLLKSIGVTIFAFFTHDGYADILSFFGVKVSYAHPPLSTLFTNPVEFSSFLWKLAHGPELLVITGRIFWVLVTLFALSGIVLYIREKGITPQLVLVVGIIGYFALTTAAIGLAVNARFRIPVDPFLFMLAFYALVSIFQKHRAVTE